MGASSRQRPVCHDQTRDGDDAALGVTGGRNHALKEERDPRFPVALGADDRQAPVVFGLMLLQIGAQVHKRLRQEASVFEQRASQQASDAAIAIKERWMVSNWPCASAS